MINKARIFFYLIHMAALTSLLILAPSEAGAHKASVFAYADNGQVQAEGFFFDGRPCRGCAISVLDADEGEGGKILVKGKTDEQGVFIFKYPIGTRPLVIRMDAGEGHLAVFTLEIKPERGQEGKVDAQVEAQAEAKLASLRAEIRRLSLESERPGLTEILGGLGYIAGLAGIWLYAQSRKRDKK